MRWLFLGALCGLWNFGCGISDTLAGQIEERQNCLQVDNVI